MSRHRSSTWLGVILWAAATCAAQDEARAPDVADDPGLPSAIALQSLFARVASDVFPSVVGVTALKRDPAWTPEPPAAQGPAWIAPDVEGLLYPGYRKLRACSGFIVDRGGDVLACHHALSGADGAAADIIDVELHDGRHFLARVVGSEPTLDLAVLRMDVVTYPQDPGFRPVRVGQSEPIPIGFWVLGLGDPSGASTTFAAGTLSSRPDRQCYQDQRVATLLEASLRVPPESYGGPLVDIHGSVIGMLLPSGDPKLEPPAARASEVALPIELAMRIYDVLKTKGSTRSPWLGISVLERTEVARRGGSRTAPGTFPRTGVYIDNVFEPSPASRAGIRVGDFLLRLGEQRIFSVPDFQKWLYLGGVGATITVEIFRDGATLTLSLVIEERPPEAAPR